MKKLLILFLALVTVFGFVACDNNPNEEASDVSMDILKTIFKEAVNHSDFLTGYLEDQPFTSSTGYSVVFDMNATKDGSTITAWTIDINSATKEGADTISFVIRSADLDKEIEVTIGEEKYKVRANDIKGDTIIDGFVGDDDEEEQTPVQDN